MLSLTFPALFSLISISLTGESHQLELTFPSPPFRFYSVAESIAFYRDILGMDLIDEHKGGDFTLYFLGYDHSNGKDSAEDKRKGRSTREALIELTHNVCPPPPSLFVRCKGWSWMVEKKWDV